MKELCGYLTDDQELNTIALSWPADVKVVAQRLFQTYNIDDRYTNFGFISLSLASQICGSAWLSSPAKFLRLITSLSTWTCWPPAWGCSKRPCGCVETETSAVSDEDATAVSRSCKEAASFCFEYLSACKEKKISLPLECLLGFYRFVCMFASLVNAEYVKDATSSLLSTCDFALNQRDMSTATQFLDVLPEFPHLSDGTLDVLFKYIRLAWPTGGRKEALERLMDVLEALKDRTDFFTPEARRSALEFAEAAGDRQLIRAVGKLKE
ncbi:hypothetical protein M3Y99_00203500 [Aphelenchoides fujianensis]|nr:hypothetical protein M3Y99_00203500 [Aphelenchoides fujianensis]